MTTATITIEMDNAAFEDVGPATELGRILRKLANDIEDGLLPESIKLYDYNGNKVGSFEIDND